MRERAPFFVLAALLASCANPDPSIVPRRPAEPRVKLGSLRYPELVPLEAALEVDLARERAVESTPRTPLRGLATNGELFTELKEAFVSLPRHVGLDFEKEVTIDEKHDWKLRLPEGPQTYVAYARENCAPSLVAIRTALQAGRMARPYDLAKDWSAVVQRRGADEDPRTAVAAFAIEALARLGEGHASEAAELALDLWRFQEDFRYDERSALTFSNVGSVAIPEIIVIRAAGSLDAASLRRFASELETIERALPHAADIVRRLRIANACYERAVARGEEGELMSRMGWGGYDLADEPPEAATRSLEERAELARVRQIARKWAVRDATLRKLEAALASLRPHVVWPSIVSGEALDGLPEEYDPQLDRRIVQEIVYQWLVRLASVRTTRVALLAESFRKRSGRWPKTIEEALGRPVSDKEQNPFTGKSITVAEDDDGDLVIGRVDVVTPGGRKYPLDTVLPLRPGGEK